MYYEYTHEAKNYEIKTREDYSRFDASLNNGDYDYMINDHSTLVFDEYSLESDND